MNSCLEFTTNRTDGLWGLDADRIGSGVDLVPSRTTEPISIDVDRTGGLVGVDVSRYGSKMAVNVGLICSLSQASYLKIDTETLWLTKDNDFYDEFLIWSNVEWTIT